MKEILGRFAKGGPLVTTGGKYHFVRNETRESIVEIHKFFE